MVKFAAPDSDSDDDNVKESKDVKKPLVPGRDGIGIVGAGRDERKPIHAPHAAAPQHQSKHKHRRDDDDDTVDERHDDDHDAHTENKRPARRVRRIDDDEEHHDDDHGAPHRDGDDEQYEPYDDDGHHSNDDNNNQSTSATDRNVTSLMLPRQLGLNAAKLHVMRASLFNDSTDNVPVDDNDDGAATGSNASNWQRNSQFAGRPGLPLTDNWPTGRTGGTGSGASLTGSYNLLPVVSTHRTPSAKKRSAPEPSLIADDDGEFAGAFHPDDHNNGVDESFDGDASSKKHALNNSGFLSPSLPRAIPSTMHTPSLARVAPRAAELGLNDFDMMSPAHAAPLSRKPYGTASSGMDTSSSSATSTSSILHPVGLISRRGFRVSWGPNGTLSYPCGTDGTSVCIARVAIDEYDDITHPEYKLKQAQVTDALDKHLKHYAAELRATPPSFIAASSSSSSTDGRASGGAPSFGRGRSQFGGMPSPSSSLFGSNSMDDSEDRIASSNSEYVPSSSTSLVLTTSTGHSSSLYPVIGASASSIDATKSDASLSHLCDEYITSTDTIQRARVILTPGTAAPPLDEDHLERTKSLWRLVKSLWSRQYSAPYPRSTAPRHMGLPLSSDAATVADMEGAYAEVYARRDAVSHWLEHSVVHEVKAECDNNEQTLTHNKNEASAATIVSLLSGHRINEACEEADQVNDLRLAVMISQIGEDATCQQDIRDQLQLWMHTGVMDTLDDHHRQIYGLLMGDTSIKPSLPWQRAFGLHLWYGEHAQNGDVTKALRAYEAAVLTGRASPANPPYPPTRYDIEDAQERAANDDASSSRGRRYADVRYGLLRLHCNQGEKLSSLLSPQSWVASPLDHSISWHLHDVLQHTSAHQLPRALDLYINFATQLQSMGLWQWAVYVIMMAGVRLKGRYNMTSKATDPNLPWLDRERIVKDIIARNIPSTIAPQGASVVTNGQFGLDLPADDSIRRTDRRMRMVSPPSLPSLDREHQEFEKIQSFLVNDVHIPSSWIHEARASRALYDRVPDVALTHLLASGQYGKAHELLITELAPHWLLKQMTTKLLPILLELEKRLPPDWSNQGGVYLQFLRLMESIHPILSHIREPIARSDVVSLTKLQKQVRDLMSKITNRIPPPASNISSLDRVAMSEMADRLALLCSEVDVSRFKRASGVELPSSDHSLFAPANDIDIASSPAALANLLGVAMTEDNRMDRLDAMCQRLLSQHSII